MIPESISVRISEMDSNKQPLAPIEVKTIDLSPEALQGVLESFVLREGTDYGAVELSFEKKVENLRRKIEKGDIHLVFDPNTESLTFLTSNEWKKVRNGSSKLELI